MKQLQHFFFLILTIGFSPSILQAQIGGAEVFEFLELPSSARITALGGAVVAVVDDDLSLAIGNPALLNEAMHQQISFNHSAHIADSQHGYAAFGFHKKNWETTFNTGIQYITYGKFVNTDEFGNELGEFKAKEFAINIGASRQVYDRLRVGANVKMITGSLESYNSFGMALDFGASYQDTSARFSAGLVIKNAGYQFSSYGDNTEALPFDIQFGITQRLKHLPFRFGIVLHNLHRGNIIFDDPNAQDPSSLLGETIEENKFGVFADNLFRHAIFNGEFLLGKKENFRLRFAYNHFRRQELKVINLTRSLTGFSLGFGIMIKRFRLAYGHQFYHLAGGNNHFSISTSLGRW